MLVRVREVVKRYPQARQAALNGISFEVAEGEFVALLGPSGSGKTTALRCIAGLETVSAGEIRLADRLVSSPKETVSPAARNIGMVFQSYALWPHMNVFDNVAYPLKVQQVPRDKRRQRVEEILGLLGMSEKIAAFPHQLSGGQQQRVALARALVAEPALILFDEPLSNLDARLRDSMRIMIRDLTRKLGVAGIYVTHDRLDALVMADRVIVMDAGALVQEGAPRELYQHPRNSFVAQFLGDVNVYEGSVLRVEAGVARVAIGAGMIELSAVPNQAMPLGPGDWVRVVIRPNQVQAVGAGEPGWNRLQGRLERAMFLGELWRYRATLAPDEAAERLDFLTIEPLPQEPGDEVELVVAPEHVVLLPAEGPAGAGSED
jgi:ABC-type Fe3+/spermidine/putrescine transport system ATPase subunit